MSDKLKSKILFVSKDPDHQFSVKSIAAEHLGEVEIADTRIRAGQLISANTYDLVITAMDLPKSSGAEFCKQMRGKKEGQSLPIVVIGEDDDKGTNCIASLTAGADDFIQYPFLTPVMLARCKRYLGKSATGGARQFLSVQASAGELPGIFQYLEADQKTGKLTIQNDDNEEKVGVIYLKEGRLVNVTATYCSAEMEAVTEVLTWKSMHVTFDEMALQDSDLKFEMEMTGTVMNCIVDVDEFHEIQTMLPDNSMILREGAKLPSPDMDPNQRKIYDAALLGYSKDELLSLQKVTERKATIWLHELIDQGYLAVAGKPYDQYTRETYQAYAGSQSLAKRLSDIKQVLSNLTFPLPAIPANVPASPDDWLTPAPKMVITGDNVDHIQIMIQSLSDISTAVSQKKPLVSKNRKGALTVRVRFGAKEVIDLQQLPPGFDRSMLNTLEEHLRETCAIVFLISAQDKKAVQETNRRLRLLRQRFKGVNYFIVPKVPNDKGVCEFRMDCSSCGYRLSVDMNMAGSMGECPICKASITIPDTLDHLAHALQLTDEVPVALIKPQFQEHCRDLLTLVADSVVTACNPPPEREEEPEVAEAPPPPMMQTQVRERANKPTTKILAAEPQVTPLRLEKKLANQPPPPEPETITTEEVELEYEQPDSSVLDAILNTDDSQFDIDAFIKSVRRD